MVRAGRSPERRPRRLAGAAALLAALAVVAWWLWLPARDDAPPLAPVAAAAPPVPAAPTSPPRARAARPARNLEALPEPIRRFLAATPYPPTSGRLTRAHVDLLEPNRRHDRHRPIPDTIGAEPEEQVTWLFTADRWAYVGPETVHARLEVERGGRPVPVEIVAATVVREGRGGPIGAPEPLEFREERDRLVADLPLHRFADHHGSLILSVAFEWMPGRVHQDELRIFSTPTDRIPGRFSGIETALHEGDLRVGVAVELDQPGFYRLDANLYGPDGEPVAFAVFKGELEPGAQTVALDVYGLVLRDAGVPGPYTVGEVRGYRFLDGQYPDHEDLPSLPDRATTAAYPLDAFTDAPHVSEHELHMVELMLDDLARGIPLAVPALPGEGAPAPEPAAPGGSDPTPDAGDAPPEAGSTAPAPAPVADAASPAGSLP